MKFNKLALGLILALSIQAHAEKVDVNFRNLSISDFIKMVGKITGKNILVDGEVKGKINFVSNKPIEKSELIPLANAILETKNMTLVNKGDYYQVVKSNDAAGEGLPVSSNINSGTGTMKTVVFQLSNANAAVIRTKIKPLLHKSAKIVSFKKDNLLAITAYPHTLKSIKSLIDKIESKQAKQSKIVNLQNARVKDVFPNVQNMAKALFPQDIESEKVDVMQDVSGNSIILVGKQSNILRLQRYIQQLDLEGEGDNQRMHVIPLANSNVEEMEKILSKIVPQMTGTDGTGATGGAVGKPTPKAVIASDLERNALIILANVDQYQNILETVKLLDVEKSQVYIQAKIVEVNTNLAENIGLKYGFNGGSITSNGLFSLAGNAGASPLALSSSLLGFLNNTTTSFDNNGNAYTSNERAFEFGKVNEVFALGAQLDLLKQNGAAQILSKPSILCTNNKESSIYVGQTQSILTQSQQSTQGSSNILNNYSREDIGITLKVKPRLSSNNKVSLEVETTIEDIVPGSGATADRPTTTKRSVKTNAIVNHAETIILGGLIKSADGKSVTKIPLLGDIPILGRLFTSKGDSESKVNVVIYLTPYIITKSSDLTNLRKHLDELESIQQQYNKIVYDTLEEKTNGTKGSGHVTFSSTSKRSTAIDEDLESFSNYTPVIETAKPVSQSKVVTQQAAVPQVYRPDPIPMQEIPQTVEYVETPSYTEEQDYVQSESIMDTLNQRKNVNLNRINTGIEYNEETTFSNVPRNN
ncbi:type II secretion system secretin GspD [bacterium]|nr:type II secretion system secretin GspD [bacterium]MBU1958407.1 type II secretion system secretin GspD [bacterium]